MCMKRMVVSVITAVAAATVALGTVAMASSDVYHDLSNTAAGNGAVAESVITSSTGSGVYHDL